MTAREMQRAVEQRLTSLDVDPLKLKSEDIFECLNIGQNMYINSRIDPTRYNNADNYASLQREIDDLRLVLREVPLVGGNLQENYRIYVVPPMYRHVIRLRVEIMNTCGDPVNKPVRIVSNHLIDNMVEDSLYKPTKKSPLAVLIRDRIRIYFSSKFALGNATITYIKEPAKIGVTMGSEQVISNNCELAEHTHDDIVELAVQYAYRILNVNQNTQTQ
jgi:hypothetical protein